MATILLKRKQTLIDGEFTEDIFFITKKREYGTSDIMLFSINEFEQLREQMKKYK